MLTSSFQEVDGNLITMALAGEFDVIAHGCNCQCVQGSGIARQMNYQFGTNNPANFSLEAIQYKGAIDKLGRVQVHHIPTYGRERGLWVCNLYTQYNYGATAVQLDYEALTLCLRKLNRLYKGKYLGLPLIGGGLAGGDRDRIKQIMKAELTDCHVTLVHYKP
ncbi:O-acetyl-ADP-ribose deacetylase (regulator of RNase III) [Spirosoma oryzae]|uniref:O-acetyl-ADP-ribose deacetylase (Regulator of RNase III) n=1 Tax=Spirosoma oryzae TaxID=1469603 RepID=A0A2T0SKB8_9BACT|nr:phosphatase [Spirosoma oryzae]PRY33858.1 O-acetyl-ADP-ribose deacetylase (regulator of RNase III) [Spirosoma oryzae]